LGNNPGWKFSNSPDFIYGLGNDTSLCSGSLLRTSNFNGAKTFTWQDGSTKPYFLITQPGIYWVKADFGQNCFYTDSVNIFRVMPTPHTGFTIDKNIQCLSGNNFLFSDTSAIDSGKVTSRLWAFGDGLSDTILNANHSFAKQDTFTVSLITYSDKGCTDTLQKDVFVYNPPSSSFTVNDTSQCFYANLFAFKNTSACNPPSSGCSFTWFFDDGSSDTIANPNHHYSYYDTFMVSLVSLSPLGCKDSFIRPVYLYPGGGSSIAINDTTQCLAGNLFVFQDFTPDTSRTWNTGDGTVNTSTTFTHSYLTADTFLLSFISYSANGCKDSLTRNIIVFPMPKAAFNTNLSSQCLKGNNFLFTNTSSGGSKPSAMTWFFGDGDTSILDSPAHSYNTADSFRVLLKVTTADGCPDFISDTVYIRPDPVASFNIWDSSQCFDRNDFGFVNTSSIPSGIITHLWDFGDGSTSALLHPHHQYSTVDTFSVTLRITSAFGCSDSFTRHAFLHIHAEPRAAFSVNDSTQCLNGNNFAFSNNSSISSGSFNPFWDFGDLDSSSFLNTNHSFNNYDTFLTKLLVVSDWGCKDSVLKQMIVHPMPVAGFSINTNPQFLGANNFVFTNSTAIPYGSLAYAWDFGDGNSSSATTPSHSYASPDTFDVMLISSSAEGCSDTNMQQAIVLLMVTTDFSASRFCQKDTVIFTSSSSAYPDSFINYLWDFGDGDHTILNPNPRHHYTDTGTYTVRLIGLTYLGYRILLHIPFGLYLPRHLASHIIKILFSTRVATAYLWQMAFTTAYYGQRVKVHKALRFPKKAATL
jgi:PKD repeat protein